MFSLPPAGVIVAQADRKIQEEIWQSSRVFPGIFIFCGGYGKRAIACTVTNCRNHCDNADFCSLDRIQVGTHEMNPTMDQCTWN